MDGYCAGLVDHTRNPGPGGPERRACGRRTATAACSATASACANRLPAHTRGTRGGEERGSPQEVETTIPRGDIAVSAASQRCCRARAMGAHRPPPGSTSRVSDNKTRWRRAPDRCGAAGSGPRAGSWFGSSADVHQVGQELPGPVLHRGHGERLRIFGTRSRHRHGVTRRRRSSERRRRDAGACAEGQRGARSRPVFRRTYRATFVPSVIPASSADRVWMPEKTRASTFSSESCRQVV